jgi:uncharacterized protein YjbI with pentapeptide repeats
MFREITDTAILDELRPAGNLRGADLREADIEGVTSRLSNIHFDDAHLEGANLQGTNLYDAYLRGAHLEGAHLEGADLTEAKIDGANFSGAHLEGAELRGIGNFRGCSFIGAFCNGINLEGSELAGANFSNAHFENTDLNSVDFRGAHLEGANFTNANLEGADFDGAFLEGANFEGVTIDDNTRFTRENLSQEQLRQLGLIEEIAPPVPGVAFEVHNQFNAINIDGITDYLNNFNNDINHPGNPNAISDNNEPNNLFTPLFAFINNSELFLPNEKETIKNNLQSRILERVEGYGNINELYPLLRSIINFVSRQENNFIEQYIRVYIQDCLEAYSGNNGASCTKGMVERIITTLNAVSTQMLTEFPENQTYNDIKRLFPNIVFNEVVEEWSRKYLQDGENEEELASLTVKQRKQHFINFMIEKYRETGLYTEPIRQQINNEADRYERDGILERMYFGGRRNKKTRRKGNKKTMKKRNKKTMKKEKNKRKKSMKKRKTMKKRK